MSDLHAPLLLEMISFDIEHRGFRQKLFCSTRDLATENSERNLIWNLLVHSRKLCDGSGNLMELERPAALQSPATLSLLPEAGPLGHGKHFSAGWRSLKLWRARANRNVSINSLLQTSGFAP